MKETLVANENKPPYVPPNPMSTIETRPKTLC